jgi:hypothetical protein
VIEDCNKGINNPHRIFSGITRHNIVKKIRTSVADNKIWISLDEISDIHGRFNANAIVGTLKLDQPGEIFLHDCEVLVRANHSNMGVLFDNSTNLLWPNGIQ